MSSRAEHYREAERLLEYVEKPEIHFPEHLIARALVHATLASVPFGVEEKALEVRYGDE